MLRRLTAITMSATEQIDRVSFGHALAGAALVSPVLSVLAPRGLNLVAVFAALTIGIVFIHRYRRFPDLSKWIGLPVVGLVLYAGISCIWTERPWDTALIWPKISAVFLAGLVLVSGARRVRPEEWKMVRNACVLGFVAGLALLAFENESDGMITMSLREIAMKDAAPQLKIYHPAFFNRAATIIALMLWPVVLIALREKRAWLALAVPIIVLIVINRTGSAAASAAIAVGAIVFLLVMLWPRWMPRLVAVLLAAGTLLAPLLVRFGLTVPLIHTVAANEPSWAHRLRVWEYTADLISQKPVFGWGFDSSRYLNTRGEGVTAVMPLHPHNGVLQIWLELGAVGAVVAAVLAIAVCIAIARVIVDRAQRAGAFAALASAVIVICLSYGIWQYWWLSGLWITAAITLLVGAGAAAPKAVSDPSFSQPVSESQ